MISLVCSVCIDEMIVSPFPFLSEMKPRVKHVLTGWVEKVPMLSDFQLHSSKLNLVAKSLADRDLLRVRLWNYFANEAL